ncbi:MinD/ParA family protein [Dehalobacter sp. DCM]|uniref:MinD/ParA family protein n=1 Tax=Dehalobacter sp. DCM TaxID=2907827 RepID=UPI003081C190|nr:MinD/ParA family protein [Dehalobacter sp. DCM]
MVDQVSTLRKLAEERVEAVPGKMRVIAVSSGKGGVGKTTFVVNLALALAEYNYKVIILDGDLGLANVDVAFGITPKYSIKHLLSGEKKIEDILYPIGRDIKVLPGASGVVELANLDRGQLKNVLVNFGRLEKMADILLIDTGAGLGHTVLNFIGASDDVIVMLTSEPPSMTDAYGLIKSIKSPSGKHNINVVVNRIKNEQEAHQSFERLERAVKKFIGIPINLLGWIYDDPSVGRSVMEQRPVGLSQQHSPAFQCVQWIAGNVTGVYLQPPTPNNGIKGFITSLLKLNK